MYYDLQTRKIYEMDEETAHATRRDRDGDSAS